MSHALIVGGTGMLWNVSIHLAEQFDMVSVIARNSYRLNSLWEEAHHQELHINPLQLDYKDEEHLELSIRDAIKQYGPIDTVVAWFHNAAPEAPVVTARILNDIGKDFRYFDIWGFIDSKDSDPEPEREEELRQFEHLQYRKIILGFTYEDDQSRWLTNEEISNGVIEAINKDNPLYIVGEISPLSEKP